MSRDPFCGYTFLDAVVAGDWLAARASIQSATAKEGGLQSFVARHGLSCYLRWRLGAEGFTELPGWLRLQLWAFQAQDDELRDRLMVQLAHVYASCDDTRLLLMKGPALAQRLYGTLAARRFVDLDLMAAPGAFEALRQQLLAAGYTEQTQALYPRGWLRRFIHAHTLVRDGLELDLHIALRVRPAYRLDHDALWQRRLRVALPGDLEVCVPCDEDSLLILILSVVHDLELGKLRAKTLVDLHTACEHWESTEDWESFFTHRRPERLEGLAVNALLMLQLVLPSVPRPRLAKALAARTELAEISSREQALELLLAAPYSTANRSWFMDCYPGSRLGYLAWLALGQPAKQNLAFALGQTFSR
ncbi:MAG: nucleotidyltransferase family protein [Pseudomonadota bacterium]